MMCSECTIGLIYDYDNTKLVTFEMLVMAYQDELETVEYFKSNPQEDTKGIYLKLSIERLGHLHPAKFLDKRKGYMQHFKYCPDCGEEIQWQELRKEAKLIEERRG